MKEILMANRVIVMVDDVDYEELNRYKWRLEYQVNSLYARRYSTSEEKERGYPRDIRMHRQIMGIIMDRSIKVDHRDNDGLNNQRSNLRIATSLQNGANKLMHNKHSSMYKGVTVRGNRYEARIGFEGKVIHLGWFHSEKEAAIAYNNRAKELFGEFACLNVIDERGANVSNSCEEIPLSTPTSGGVGE